MKRRVRIEGARYSPREWNIMEPFGAFVTMLLLILGLIYLTSQRLIVRFWLWRWYRRRTAAWSIPLGLSWLLLLVGLAGSLLEIKLDAASGLYLLCFLISMVCLLIAVLVFAFQQAIWQAEDRESPRPGPPTLRRTFRADPAAKRFILTGYGRTGGIALLICLSLVVTFAVRRHLVYSHRRAIIALIQNGTLQASRTGDVTLPPSLASMTVNGHVYVGQVVPWHDRNIQAQQGPPVYFFPRLSDRYDFNHDAGKPPQWQTQMEGYVCIGRFLPRAFWQVDFPGTDIRPLINLQDDGAEQGWYYGRAYLFK